MVDWPTRPGEIPFRVCKAEFNRMNLIGCIWYFFQLWTSYLHSFSPSCIYLSILHHPSPIVHRPSPALCPLLDGVKRKSRSAGAQLNSSRKRSATNLIRGLIIQNIRLFFYYFRWIAKRTKSWLRVIRQHYHGWGKHMYPMKSHVTFTVKKIFVWQGIK